MNLDVKSSIQNARSNISPFFIVGNAPFSFKTRTSNNNKKTTEEKHTHTHGFLIKIHVKCLHKLYFIFVAGYRMDNITLKHV